MSIRVVRRHWKLVAALGVSVALLASPLPALAATVDVSAPTMPDAKPVPGTTPGPVKSSRPDYPRLKDKLPAPKPPTPGSVTVTAPARGAGAVAAGSLPVKVEGLGAGSVPLKVTLLDTAALQDLGAAGVALMVARMDGVATPAPVRLTVDYSPWLYLYGANFGDRLTLRQAPLCAVFAPGLGCPELPRTVTRNDRAAKTLTIDTVALPDLTGTPAQAASSATPSPESSESAASPTAAAEASASAQPSDSPTAAPSPSASPAATGSPAPVPSPSASPTATASASPAPSPSASPTASPSASSSSLGVPAAPGPQARSMSASAPTVCANSNVCDAEGGLLPGSDPDQPVVLTAGGTPNGAGGNFAVTGVLDAGQWASGNQAGDFNYSYSVPMPPSIGGAVPNLTLNYSAQSVDGRVSSQNAQASVFGMGWDASPGYVQQNFMSCGEQTTNTTAPLLLNQYADLCMPDSLATGETNYTLSLGGVTGRLFGSGSTYRLENDPGWRITKGSDETWTVENQDGTKYYFGLATNGPNGSQPTNALWTVPVVQTTAGNVCNPTIGGTCVKAWRANLAAVEDTNRNAQYYFYTKRTNSYQSKARNTRLSYVRGGYLNEIRYGVAAGFADYAPASKVTIGVADRCVEHTTTGAACPALSAANAQSYPDVPTDLICTSSTSCPAHLESPSFFESDMVTRVITWVRDGTSYSGVDQVDLDYTFPTNAYDSSDYSQPDGQTPALFLDDIVRMGVDAQASGVNVTVPALSFSPQILANRVDTTASVLPMAMPRIQSVETETGDNILVTYSKNSGGTDPCVETNLPSQTNNGQQCFQIYYSTDAGDTGYGTYFKYTVERVQVVHPTGSASPTETFDYVYYPDSTAQVLWDYDFNATTNHHVFSVWKGFPRVRTIHGAGATQSVTDRWYYTGFAGHPTSTNGTGSRSNSIITSKETTSDNANFFGYLLREESKAGVASTTDLVSTRHFYQFTASVGSSPAGFHTAGDTITDTRISGSGTVGYRKTRVNREFDVSGSTANGQLLTEWVMGEVNPTTLAPLTALDMCTRYLYSKNSSNWLSPAYDIRGHDGSCVSGTPVTARKVNWFDGSTTTGATPSKGNITKSQVYKTASTVQVTGATYDTHGRALTTYDQPDTTQITTSTSYGPSPCQSTALACSHPTTITTTAPTGIGDVVTQSSFDWGRGVPETVTDPNGQVTQISYDRLGRPLSVTAPGDSTSCPTQKWDYILGQSVPSRVQHHQLLDVGASCASPRYVSDFTFLDSSGRVVQTQTDSPGSGVVMTWTNYTDRGQVDSVSEPFFSSTGVGTFVVPSVPSIPTRYQTLYDLLGRPTAKLTIAAGTELWRTTTAYAGDAVTVSPPAIMGAGSTKSWTDAFGRVTKIDENENGQTYSTWQTYNRLGQLIQVKDRASKITTTAYDFLGHPTSSNNPNSGARTMTYDGAGNLKTVVRNGVTLTSTLDVLHRPTQLTATPAGGTARNLKRWTYGSTATDTLPGSPQLAARQRGRLMKAESFDAGDNVVSQSTSYDAKGRPTSQTWNVPAALGAADQAVPTLLTGDWTATIGYDKADHPVTMTYPTKTGASTGLPAETVTAVYDSLGLPDSLSSSTAGTLVPAQNYRSDGRLSSRSYSTAGGNQTATFVRGYAWRTDVTSRLDRVQTTQSLGGAAYTTIQNDQFSYDALGQPTQVSDLVSGQNQCYLYDQRLRLKRAFTSANTCTPSPTDPGSGADGYDTPYTYNATLDGLTTAGGRTYTYSSTTVQPHAPTAITNAGVTDNLDYTDATGELSTRSNTTGTTTYTWDDLGQLAKTATTISPATTTLNSYDAGGVRLLHRSGTTTTLSIGGQELTATDAAPTISNKAIRQYTLGGAGIAARVYTAASSTAKLLWTMNDRANSAEISIDDTGTKAGAPSSVLRKRYTPFGADRNGIDLGINKDFLNKTKDTATDLVHLGARYYSPKDGIFISTDPLAGASGTASLNPYNYANNNPAANSDPSGLITVHDSGGAGSSPSPTFYSSGPSSPNSTQAAAEAHTAAVGELAYAFMTGSAPSIRAAQEPLSTEDKQLITSVPCIGGCNAATRSSDFASWQEDGYKPPGRTAYANAQFLTDMLLVLASLPLGVTAPAKAAFRSAARSMAAEGGATFGQRARGVLLDDTGAVGAWSISGRVKAAGLPNGGPIRYVPPTNYRPGMPLPRGGSHGYVDRFGNEWVKGPSRTADDAFEWDVQLSDRGRASIGWLSRDGSHVNVSLDGWVTH